MNISEWTNRNDLFELGINVVTRLRFTVHIVHRISIYGGICITSIFLVGCSGHAVLCCAVRCAVTCICYMVGRKSYTVQRTAFRCEDGLIRESSITTLADMCVTSLYCIQCFFLHAVCICNIFYVQRCRYFRVLICWC